MKQILNQAEFYEEGTSDDTPVLLMLPGVGCGTKFFHDALSYFLPKFKVLLFNNPGMEDTPMPLMLKVENLTTQVVKILDELEINECYVLGHSMGGFNAQELAITHPDRVKKLILVSTSYGGPFSQQESQRLSKVLMPRMSEFRKSAKGDGDADFKFIVGDKFHQKTKEYEEYLKFYRSFRPSLNTVLRHFHCGLNYSSFGRVHSILTPTLVAHGEADQLIHLEGAKLLAGQIPNARLWMLAECGHMPMVEKSNFYPRVLDFLLGEQVGEESSDDAPGYDEANHHHTLKSMKNVMTELMKNFTKHE